METGKNRDGSGGYHTVTQHNRWTRLTARTVEHRTHKRTILYHPKKSEGKQLTSVEHSESSGWDELFGLNNLCQKSYIIIQKKKRERPFNFTVHVF